MNFGETDAIRLHDALQGEEDEAIKCETRMRSRIDIKLPPRKKKASRPKLRKARRRKN